MEHHVVIDKDFEDLVPTFLNGRKKDIEFIKKYLEENDFETLGYIGHKIKGAGYNYGFEEIGIIGEKIENSSKRQDVKDINDQLLKLESYIKNIKITYEEM